MGFAVHDVLENGRLVEDLSDDDGTLAWDLDQNRAHNKANEIAGNSGDPIWPEGSSGGWVDPQYDAAGNMIYGPRPCVVLAVGAKKHAKADGKVSRTFVFD